MKLANACFLRHQELKTSAGRYAAGALSMISRDNFSDRDVSRAVRDQPFIPSDLGNMLQAALELGILVSDGEEAI